MYHFDDFCFVENNVIKTYSLLIIQEYYITSIFSFNLQNRINILIKCDNHKKSTTLYIELCK